MENTAMYSAIENRILSQQRAKRRVAILVCVCTLIVGITGALLMMPADTASQETFCGFEEHTHDDKCYEIVGERELICTIEEGAITHEHTDACYKEQPKLICTLAESDGHTHSDACYQQQSVLSCGLEETDGHIHTDACFGEERSLSCGREESSGHVHSGACYTAVSSLTCTIPESSGHQHDASCYDAEGDLICGLTEGEGAHWHSDACYTTESVLTCGLAEGEGAHTHSDACYTVTSVLHCGQEEVAPHRHDASCYTMQDVLVCGQKEQEAHHHTESCYEIEESLVCTESTEPHVHTDACYTGEKALVCDKPEHEHTLACFSNPTANLENPDIWARLFEGLELSGDWNKDVITVAASQLGYTESELNYQVDPDGTSIHGYTRYGAWYGYPYSEWCAMFCSFVFNYAEVDKDVMPYECVCTRWVETLDRLHLWHPVKDNYSFRPGDLIFFDTDKDGLANHVGFVYKYDDVSGILTTIEGNRIKAVDTFEYYPEDESILGYGQLPANPHPENAASHEALPAMPVEADVPSPDAGKTVAFDGDVTLTEDDNTVSAEDVALTEEGSTVSADDITLTEDDITVTADSATVTAPEDALETFTIYDGQIVREVLLNADVKIEATEADGVVTLKALVAGVDPDDYIWQWQVAEVTPEKAEETITAKLDTDASDIETDLVAVDDLSEAVPEETPEDTAEAVLDNEPVSDGQEVLPVASVIEESESEEIKEIIEDSVPAEESVVNPGETVSTAEPAEVTYSELPEELRLCAQTYDHFLSGAELPSDEQAAVDVYSVELIDEPDWQDIPGALGLEYSFSVGNDREGSRYYRVIGVLKPEVQSLLLMTAEEAEALLPGMAEDLPEEESAPEPDAFEETENNISALEEQEPAEEIPEAVPEELPEQPEVIMGVGPGVTPDPAAAPEQFADGEATFSVLGVFKVEAYADDIPAGGSGGQPNVLAMHPAEVKSGAVYTNWSQDNRIWMGFDASNGAELDDNGVAIGGYNYGAKLVSVQADGYGNFTTPTEAQVKTSQMERNYTLRGWYDIINGGYYLPGETYNIRDMQYKYPCFYADWVDATYNYGGSYSGLNIIETPDISDFVTTRLFDYNELFNAARASATYISSDDTNEASYLRGRFKWTWNSNASGSANKYVFFGDHALNDSKKDKTGIIGYPLNVWGTDYGWSYDHNWSGGTSPATGLFSSALAAQLYDTTGNTLGVTYVGEASHFYRFNPETSEYFYDSAENAASYSKTDGRIYVYDKKLNVGNNNATKGGFVPFNSPNKDYYVASSTTSNSHLTNYWFGLTSEIQFYLPDNSKKAGGTGGNQVTGTNGEAHDMIFEFTGDDDIWVFVDDRMVLDLGGIHGRVKGTINFNTGVVQATDSDGNLSTTSFDGKFTAGDHKLTLYYMERGANESNFSCTFSIVPTYELDITKTGTKEDDLLSGAAFTVYSDEACTQETAGLYKLDLETGSKESVGSTFTTEDGRVNIFGLVPGKTYWLKETTPPANYPNLNDTINKIKVQVDPQGMGPVEVQLDDAGTQWKFVNLELSSDSGRPTIKLDAYNDPFIGGETELFVKKTWENVPEDMELPEITIELFYLDSNGDMQSTGRIMKLPVVNKETGAKSWENSFKYLPENDPDGNPYRYVIQESDVPDGFISSTVPKYKEKPAQLSATPFSSASVTPLVSRPDSAGSTTAQFRVLAASDEYYDEQHIIAWWGSVQTIRVYKSDVSQSGSSIAITRFYISDPWNPGQWIKQEYTDPNQALEQLYSALGENNGQGQHSMTDAFKKGAYDKFFGSNSVAVTYKVVNGYWDNGTNDSSDKSETVTLASATSTGSLTKVPAVGSKPAKGYKAGSWNETPSSVGNVGTKTYTYTYVKDTTQTHSVSYTINYYKDGVLVSSDTVTDTKSAWIGDAVSTSLPQYYKASNKYSGYAFDKEEISGDKVYSLSSNADGNKSTTINVYYATDVIGTSNPNAGDGVPDKYQVKVSYEVVNGAWNNSSTSAVTEVVTLKKNGVNSEDGSATLTAPSVGSKPNDGYEAGGWDTTPGSVGKSDNNKVYTYRYQRAPQSYVVEYYYDGVSGDPYSGAPRGGKAELGTTTNVSPRSSVWVGNNRYVLGEVIQAEITDTGDNIVKVYYKLDESEDPPEDGVLVGWELTNRRAPVEIPVEKVWSEGTPEMDSVTFGIYQLKNGVYEAVRKGDAPYTVTLSASESDPDASWKGIFQDVNMFPGTYYVAELESHGYDVTFSGGDAEEITVGSYTFPAVKVTVTADSTSFPAGAEYVTGPTVTATNTVKNGTIKIQKVDQLLNPIPVAGVSFELYTDEECTQKYGDTYTTDDQGEITAELPFFSTYYIKELNSPPGYNRMTDVTFFTLTPDERDDSKTVITLQPNDPALKTGTNADELLIVNTSGYELPKTGGPGTAIFYISGILLASGALIYGCIAFTKKREGRHVNS